MILYKINDCHKITAEKQKDGFYTVYNVFKNVFGNSWQKIALKSGYSLEQMKQLKKQLSEIYGGTNARK